MTTRRRAREVALQVLYEEDINPLREYSVADQFVNKRMLFNKPLVAFSQGILYGVRENRTEIDKALSRHAANWSLRRMTTIDRNILRISAYEILFGDVPGRVSINEAIELAKRYGSRNSSQFVNGILDRILKEKQKAQEAANAPQSPADTDEESLTVNESVQADSVVEAEVVESRGDADADSGDSEASSEQPRTGI